MSAELYKPSDPRAALLELGRINSIVAKRRWKKDPVKWVADRLGESLWSVQRTILESVRDHRKTAVASAHDIGKSFIAARAVGWWIDTHEPGQAIAITTAPTAHQVRTILWKEIGRVQAKLGIGRTNQTEWYVNVPGSKEELVAFGRKPSDYSPQSFQGIRADAVLVVVDEACGVSKLWDAIHSLTSNDFSRELDIGNPDMPATDFHGFCERGSDHNVIHVSAFDTPEFTGEEVPEWLAPKLIGRSYIEGRRKKWARSWMWVDKRGEPSTPALGSRVVPPEGVDATDTHPFWQSKVLGVFPQNSGVDGLIPMPWISDAQSRELEPGEPNELGVDVGGGGDSSTIAHRRGPVVRVVHEDHNPDTMHTCAKVIELRAALGAKSVKVDRIGIGAGVVDRGKEKGEPFFGISVAESPTCNCGTNNSKHSDDCNCERFFNLRAQLWWELRDRFEQGRIDLDPSDEETASELLSVRFFRTTSGIQIESKAQMSRRGVASPNRAEAVMLAFASSPVSEQPEFVVLW